MPSRISSPLRRSRCLSRTSSERRSAGIEASVQPPELIGPPDADVTLIGWGSTQGVIQEAREMLAEEGITANQLQIRWMVAGTGPTLSVIFFAVSSGTTERNTTRELQVPLFPGTMAMKALESVALRATLSW
jgi:hypothetical protein